jgi:hypothetical protein
MRREYLTVACAFLFSIGGFASDTVAPGFLEGSLKILPFKDVELAGESASKFSNENYAEYPLVVLSQDSKKEIARITADENGKYRVALPPGDYLLDVQRGRPQGPLRVKPQRFTVASNQIAHIDMYIDPGIR